MSNKFDLAALDRIYKYCMECGQKPLEGIKYTVGPAQYKWIKEQGCDMSQFIEDKYL